MRSLVPFHLLTFCSFVLLSSTLANSNEKCPNLKAISASMRLNSCIKCNLSKGLGSIRNTKNTTSVSILIRLQSIIFDESNNILEAIGFIFTSWYDDNLTWNYTDFDGLKWTSVRSRDIWRPDITILSIESETDKEHGLRDTCKLNYDGRLQCISNARHRIRCQSDFKLWPYNRQKCTFALTSWAYSSAEMNMVLMPGALFGSNSLRIHDQWNFTMSRVIYELRESNYGENLHSSLITIDILLDRMQIHFGRRYGALVIIMMLMTLTGLALDPKSIERLAIVSLNIIVHVMFIQDIHWALPHNGPTVPDILIFYVNSFVIATVTLILTFVLRKIEDARGSAPKWITLGTTRILRSKAGQYLLLGILDPRTTADIEIDAIDNVEIMSSEPKETAWTYVAILFRWISFIVLFFTYIIMYAVLIPSSAANSPIDSGKHRDNKEADA